jgi:AcrR family transcriptional regulator
MSRDALGGVLIVVDSPPGTAGVRTRDPDRKNRILLAASDLIGRKGFHAVSIADIGNAAGITGSGVYRHFDSKSAILVALFDRVIDDLIAEEQRILDGNAELPTALEQLIEGQVEFVVGDRQLAQVYYNEINNLPDEDRRRLRRKQRLYLEEWVHLVDELREDLDDTEARVVVHAAIGAIQSPLFHNTGLADDQLRVLLTDSARAILSTSRAGAARL